MTALTKSPDVAPEVAYFSQWFSPEPVLVPVWIADALRRRNVDLRVHTGVPNFPTGKVVQGYRARRFMRETVDGHSVVRTPLYPSHDGSAARRILNYLSWALSASLASLILCRRTSASVVYGSPATAALPAMVARLAYGVPYVLFIQDLWPDSVTSTNMVRPGWSLRVVEAVLNAFTKLSYRMADKIAVISPGMQTALEERGVPSSKISLVYNWVNESSIRPAEPAPGFRATLGLTDEFLIIYGGNLGAAQSLEVAIEAVAASDQDVHLALVGDGIDKARLQGLAAERCPDRVHFVRPVAPDQFPAVMAAGDVQLVCLRDDPLFAITMPSKVQAILAAGQPVIASAPGDAARLVRESGAGWSAAPGDATALARTIRLARAEGPEALRLRGEAARSFYRQHLSEEVNANVLVALLHQIIRKGT